MLVYLRLVLDQLVRTLAIGGPPDLWTRIQPKLKVPSSSVTANLLGSLYGKRPRLALLSGPIMVDAVRVPALAIRLCALNRL